MVERGVSVNPVLGYWFSQCHADQGRSDRGGYKSQGYPQDNTSRTPGKKRYSLTPSADLRGDHLPNNSNIFHLVREPNSQSECESEKGRQLLTT